MNLSLLKMAAALAMTFVVLGLPAPAVARESIGIILKFRGGDFWGAVEQGAKEAAAEANVDLVIKGVRGSGYFGAQLKFLEGLVSQKTDAIVITPANPVELAAPLKALAAQGIKIVLAETQLPENSTMPYVGLDQTKMSLAAAKAFAAVVKDGNEVSMFRGTNTDYVLQQREPAIIAALKKAHPNLKLHLNIYNVENEAGSVEDKAELLLTGYPGSKLFIATSSLSTRTLVQVAKDNNLNHRVKIGGFGSVINAEIAADIESGFIPVYVLQQARDIGYKSVAAAVALVRGEKVPLVTNTDFFIVTKENVNDPKLKPLFVN